MKFQLDRCPEWPSLMRREVAEAYLGGCPQVLDQMIELGYLETTTNKHRLVTWAREDIDAARRMLKAGGGLNQPEPRQA